LYLLSNNSILSNLSADALISFKKGAWDFESSCAKIDTEKINEIIKVSLLKLSHFVLNFYKKLITGMFNDCIKWVLNR